MKRPLQLGGSIAALIATSAMAQDPATRISARQAAELMAAFGPQAVSALRANETVAIIPSSLPARQQSLAVEEMLQGYSANKARYAAWSDALQWGEAATDLSKAAALLYVGPQAAATIPATLGFAVLATGMKVAREEVDAYALSENRKLLAAYAPAIEAELGLGYEQMRATILQDREAALNQFMHGTETLKDLRQRAAGDPELERTAVGIFLDTIANTTAAQMTAIADNTTRIEDLEDNAISLAKELKEFDRKTDERLDTAEAAITRLDSSVETLKVAVADVDQRVSNLEVDQAVVADFVFDQMPAAEKVRRLEEGFMGNRFACPPPAETCEASELKASLIARYKAEAEFADALQDLGSVTGAMNDISTIANNLGVDLPEEVDVAIGVANIAVAALSASTGLGAVAAISGLAGMFGGSKSDADAEQHRQLMAYLDRRFDAIDSRLEEIVANQKLIIEGIVGLSEQMQRSFERMDRTLARMEYEQDRMGEGVRALIWAPWRACYDVYRAATYEDENNPPHVDPVTMTFLSEQHIRSVINQTGDGSALPCLQVMQPALTSTTAPLRFGNFTDLRWVLNDGPLENATPASLAVEEANGPAAPDAAAPAQAPAVEWRSRLMKFDQEVFVPALGRANTITQAHLGGHMADAFVLLARPMNTTADWRGAFKAAQAAPLTCQPGQAHAEKRLCRLLSPMTSQGRRPPDQQAVDLLARPILGDIVLEITGWVILMAQISDRRDQGAGKWTFIDDHLARMAEGGAPPGPRNGERLIEGAIDMLDIAVASYAMIYGPLPARVAADEVLAGADPDQLIRNFNENAYLAHNALQFVLEDLHRQTAGRDLPPEGTYRQYYEYALKDETGRFLFLQGLFGPLSRFSVTEQGEPGFLVEGSSSSIVIPLPAPDAFTSGHIAMPPAYSELVAARADLVDRLHGYRMLDTLDAETAEAAALALLN